MWCLWIAMMMTNAFTSYSFKPPDPIVENKNSFKPPDPIVHKETNAKTFKELIGEYFNADSLVEDNYYDNGDEYEVDQYQVDDMLMLYNVFDDTDDFWDNDLQWDVINTMTLQDNEKITQKCVYWTDFDSFCVCRFVGRRTKYECKENEEISRTAAKKVDNANLRSFDDDELEDSSDEWWKQHHPEDQRDPNSVHHVFNYGLNTILDNIDSLFQSELGKDVHYRSTWDYTIPSEIAEVIFAHRLTPQAIKGRMGKLKLLEDTQHNRKIAKESIIERNSQLDFYHLIAFYKFKVKKWMGREGYRYLGVKGDFDHNSIVFQQAIEPLREAFKAMIIGGRDALARTKPDLVQQIRLFTQPAGEIRIKGLKRWYAGGIHAGHGAAYGRRGYSVSYPLYMDGEIARFMYEHDGRGNDILCVDPSNGAILNPEHYAEWVLLKQFDLFIFQKLKGIPDDIERLLQ